MNKHTVALRRKGLTLVDLTKVAGLAYETVVRFVIKHGATHPRVEEWVKAALIEKQKEFPDEFPVESANCLDDEQLHMFRNSGYQAVIDTHAYQEAKLAHDLVRASFINDRRESLEAEGQRVVETRLAIEALQHPALLLSQKNVFEKRAVMERARIDYLVAGYALNGFWPPFFDVKGERSWI